MHRLARPIAPLLFLACVFDNGAPLTTCSTEYVYGVQVSVRDATTGAPAACGADVRLRDGLFEERLEVQRPRSCDDGTGVERVFGAGERPGTYTLTVSKPGYDTWVRSGIEVSAGACHVRTVAVAVNLIESRVARSR